MQTDDSDAKFRNWWLYCEADSAGSPQNVGECRRIKTFSPGSQTITTTSAFTSATTTTMTIGLFARVPPIRHADARGLDEFINDCLRSLYYKAPVLLTLVTDGDMETSGTTNWTASNATLTKSTTSARLGKQSLRVQNTLANGYARSALIAVAENQGLRVRADVLVASGTAKLQLYDETNGAEIDSVTSTQLGWRYLYLNNYAPTDCKQVSVRLVGVEASADVYWDNVSLRRANTTEIDLPSWLEADTAVLEVEEWRHGGQTTSEDDVAIDEGGPVPVDWWEVVSDGRGLTPWRLRYTPAGEADSLLVAHILKRHPDLSTDSDTTDADSDWITWQVLTSIYEEKGDEANYKRAAARLTHIGRPLQPRVVKRMMGPRPY